MTAECIHYWIMENGNENAWGECCKCHARRYFEGRPTKCDWQKWQIASVTDLPEYKGLLHTYKEAYGC